MEEPTPMKRLVRCRLVKRRRGAAVTRALFSVVFTCRVVGAGGGEGKGSAERIRNRGSSAFP